MCTVLSRSFNYPCPVLVSVLNEFSSAHDICILKVPCLTMDPKRLGY